MTNTCAITEKPLDWTEQDLKLFKKLDVSPSTTQPEFRHQRKMAFRNEKSLYLRTCDLCKKENISMFRPDSPFTVYCPKCWWSDNWNAEDFSQEYDETRPFLEQYHEFQKKVPKCALDNFDNENCNYANYVCHNKDSYMLFGSWFSEKTMYANTTLHCLECMDTLYPNKCKHSYELIDCENCYELFYAQNCNSCSNSYFLFDCRNCQDCLFCWNLRSKQYHIMNKPVSKEEYEETLAKFQGSFSKTKHAYKTFKQQVQDQALHKYMEGEKNENVSGNLLWGCKNTQDVFYGLEVEDVTHSVRTSKKQKDSMFINGCSGGELMYDSIHCDFCHNGKSSIGGEHNSDFAYCMICYQCSDIFACHSLRHKNNCIFNKQYSPEE